MYSCKPPWQLTLQVLLAHAHHRPHLSPNLGAALMPSQLLLSSQPHWHASCPSSLGAHRAQTNSTTISSTGRFISLPYGQPWDLPPKGLGPCQSRGNVSADPAVWLSSLSCMLSPALASPREAQVAEDGSAAGGSSCPERLNNQSRKK